MSGHGTIWLSNLNCTGEEEALDECPNSGFGHHPGCGHENDVGVTCEFQNFTSCEACPSGTFGTTDVTGSNCVKCPPGTSNDIEGSLASEDCKVSLFDHLNLRVVVIVVVAVMWSLLLFSPLSWSPLLFVVDRRPLSRDPRPTAKAHVNSSSHISSSAQSFRLAKAVR